MRSAIFEIVCWVISKYLDSNFRHVHSQFIVMGPGSQQERIDNIGEVSVLKNFRV